MIGFVLTILFLIGATIWIRRHPPEEFPHDLPHAGMVYPLQKTVADGLDWLWGCGTLMLGSMVFSEMFFGILLFLLLVGLFIIGETKRDPIRMAYGTEGLTMIYRKGERVFIPGEEVCHLSFYYNLRGFRGIQMFYCNSLPDDKSPVNCGLLLHTTKGQRFSVSSCMEDGRAFEQFWHERPESWGSAPTHLKGTQRFVVSPPYSICVLAAAVLVLVNIMLTFGFSDASDLYRWDAQHLNSTRITFSSLEEKKVRGLTNYCLTDSTGQEYWIDGNVGWYFAVDDFKEDVSEGEPLWIVYAEHSRSYGRKDMIFGLLDEELHLRFIPHTDSDRQLYGIDTVRYSYLDGEAALKDGMVEDPARPVIFWALNVGALLCLLCIPYFRYAARHPERHRTFLYFYFKHGHVLTEQGTPMGRNRAEGITYYRV